MVTTLVISALSAAAFVPQTDTIVSVNGATGLELEVLQLIKRQRLRDARTQLSPYHVRKRLVGKALVSRTDERFGFRQGVAVFGGHRAPNHCDSRRSISYSH